MLLTVTSHSKQVNVVNCDIRMKTSKCCDTCSQPYKYQKQLKQSCGLNTVVCFVAHCRLKPPIQGSNFNTFYYQPSRLVHFENYQHCPNFTSPCCESSVIVLHTYDTKWCFLAIIKLISLILIQLSKKALTINIASLCRSYVEIQFYNVVISHLPLYG